MDKLPLHSDIAAIVPHYTAQGDHTVILTITGETICCTYRLRTILQHIAYKLCVDLAAIKKHTSQATQQAILQPLPLSSALLLVPVKIRIPRTAGDPSIGYINLFAITNILEEKTVNPSSPYRSSLQLRGTHTLPAIWTCSTIKKQLRYARLSVAALPGYPATACCREASHPYTPQLRPLAQKLVELIYDILLLKQN
jgi:hypothetical protein